MQSTPSSCFKRELALYIRKECLENAPDTQLMLGKLPGARYKSQYYLSRLLYSSDWLPSIVDEFEKIIRAEIGHFQFQITGREWSSIPLLIGISQRLTSKGIPINSFMIKRHRKTYGIHNYIEGRPNDLPVLIVDDLCNSTDSFRHCAAVVKDANLPILPYIFAVLNKYRYDPMDKEPEYFDRYLGRKFKALSLLNGDDIHAS